MISRDEEKQLCNEAGTVVLSISTQVTDLDDCYTNPSVVRRTVYSETTPESEA